jgi:23S rRNA (cytosine1962-C5)-methyltransferase
MSTQKTITLKPLRPERYGHAWIYDNEVARPPEEGFEDGGIVTVIDHNKKAIGVGYYNQKSKLPLRFISTDPNERADHGFWKKRVQRAFDYRKARYGTLPFAYRLIHGESDLLPGLIVDAYGDVLVVQFLTLGMDVRREVLLDSLQSVLFPKTIFERSDNATRKLEGLEEKTGLLRGELPPDYLELEDEGATILVDVYTGAKTGLFLDQIENQKAAAREARGRDVLNCFAYTGLFGLRAALAGAKTVTDVEISAPFSEVNKQQWKRNSRAVCPHTIVTDNAFDYLHMLEEKKYRTDMVILDPPAFTKSRAQIQGALRGYNDINRTAMKLLNSGGVLVTCSCSHHVSLEDFRGVLLKAASDAGKAVRLIEQRGAPADHPSLFSVPESEYLKCLVLEIE